MDPETTGFINVENKPLPFKNNFKYHTRVTELSQAQSALVEYYKNPEIKSVVFDSFSAYVDLLLAHCRASKKGFDIWNMYNEEIGKLLNMFKKYNKEIFVVAHYEILNVEGNLEKRVKVKGKEWEGTVEKEFAVVMYADCKVVDSKREYYFSLNTDGETSAKTPPEIFGEGVDKIPNDCNEVLKKIWEFAGA